MIGFRIKPEMKLGVAVSATQIEGGDQEQQLVRLVSERENQRQLDPKEGPIGITSFFVKTRIY